MGRKKDVREVNPSSEIRVAKKPYQAPQLFKWGSLRDITKSAGSTSSVSDGAMKQPNRTH